MRSMSSKAASHALRALGKRGKGALQGKETQSLKSSDSYKQHPQTPITALPQNSIREKPALNLNLYLAAFHNNYCITWHRGHGPTWTRRALGEQGGELGMPFSHTSLQNQFSSPKWQTENRRRKEKLLPFAGSSSVLNMTWSQQLWQYKIQPFAFLHKNLFCPQKKPLLILRKILTHSHPNSSSLRYLRQFNLAQEVLRSILGEHHPLGSRERHRAAAARFWGEAPASSWESLYL